MSRAQTSARETPENKPIGSAERVDALIQAALECHPMLVERVLVQDDIRAETTRVLGGRRQMNEPRRRNESRLLLGNA